MDFGNSFFLASILLGIGLAMDAFSVSLANGLNEPCMRKSKMVLIAIVFAFFQALMPMIGWICVHTVIQYFKIIETIIPWIALIVLGFIGVKMIIEGIKNDGDVCSIQGIGITALLVQGVATSIDALSVGFAIANYNLILALVSSLIIAFVTFVICVSGVAIGKKAGTYLAGKAGIFGGLILVALGLEIFITNF